MKKVEYAKKLMQLEEAVKFLTGKTLDEIGEDVPECDRIFLDGRLAALQDVHHLILQLCWA